MAMDERIILLIQAVDFQMHRSKSIQEALQCDDGLDNDGDGRLDYPNDEGHPLPTPMRNIM